VAAAIDQCVDTRVSPDLVLQAIAAAGRLGRIAHETAEQTLDLA
jgi:hypothetical protein